MMIIIIIIIIHAKYMLGSCSTNSNKVSSDRTAKLLHYVPAVFTTMEAFTV